MSDAPAPYSDEFYRAQQAGRQSAEEIVPMVLDLVHPTRVIDVGCGVGAWLAVFAERGVEILGIDGLQVDSAMLQIPAERLVRHDLTRPLRIGAGFDLVVSLEVAEHLPPEHARTFVASLTGLGPVVLFSAAIPFQGGTHHVNEQWPDYWVELFEARGYAVLDCIRPRVWGNPRVEWWYAQNTLLFVSHDRLQRDPRLLQEREGTVRSQLAMVHPRKYLEVIAWTDRLRAARHDLAAIVPAEGTVILADQGWFGEELLAGGRVVPFLERNGQYWGPPADDAAAIDELDRERAAGARFIIVAWPAFWWLDHYAGFHRHLRARYRCVLENERLVVFDLGRASPPADRDGQRA